MRRAVGVLVWAVVALLACDDETTPGDDGGGEVQREDRGIGVLPVDAAPDTMGWDDDATHGGDAGASDGGPGADLDDPGTDPDSGPEPPPEECPGPLPARLGVHVEDVDGPPLEAADRVRVSIDVVGEAVDREAYVRVRHGNLRVDVESLRLDGGPVESFLEDGTRLAIRLATTRPGQLTYEAEVLGQPELVVVLARLGRTAEGCDNPASGSGALLQLIGGVGKTAVCVPLAEFTTLQVAPDVPLQDTRRYREQNGVRDDLLAEDFIFCPQSPTIVHSAEFCATVAEGATVALAGHHGGGGDWGVDDFLLVEVLRDRVVVADATTTQRHPGGNTFYCPELDELLCTEGCTAQLLSVDGQRPIESLAVAESTGAAPRRHDDGAVGISAMLPRDTPFNLRLTALDMGVEGEVTPALYLVTTP